MLTQRVSDEFVTAFIRVLTVQRDRKSVQVKSCLQLLKHYAALCLLHSHHQHMHAHIRPLCFDDTTCSADTELGKCLGSSMVHELSSVGLFLPL
jgi:hypothetical protein